MRHDGERGGRITYTASTTPIVINTTTGGEATTWPKSVSAVVVVGRSAWAAAANEPATMSATTSPTIPATHTKPRAVRRTRSRSRWAEKIRANATSSVT